MVQNYHNRPFFGPKPTPSPPPPPPPPRQCVVRYVAPDAVERLRRLREMILETITHRQRVGDFAAAKDLAATMAGFDSGTRPAWDCGERAKA